MPYGVSLRLPLDTQYTVLAMPEVAWMYSRRNGVKGGRSPFISTLDGEGADTLGRQGKALASPLAPFRAGGYCGQACYACTGAGWETLLGEHWEQSDLCEG